MLIDEGPPPGMIGWGSRSSHLTSPPAFGEKKPLAMHGHFPVSFQDSFSMMIKFQNDNAIDAISNVIISSPLFSPDLVPHSVARRLLHLTIKTWRRPEWQADE